MLEQTVRSLPLGNADFPLIREQNAVYVDKTADIFELCRSNAKIFLARPRRFGKTLLVSTIESLFRFGRRDFSGLAIEARWTDRAYAVIRLDLSMAKDFSDMEEFDLQLDELLARAMKLSGVSLPQPQEGKALQNFIDWLAFSPRASIVLLIDEYDAPLTAHLDDPALFSQVQRRLSRLFSAIKAYGASLRFFFMTGVTKLSNTGIFSGFNNLTDISLASSYAALLGYTEEEIRRDFSPYVARAAHALGCSEESVMRELKRQYNGFCFDEKASCRVYCPWSVLNFFNEPSRGFLNYWYQSSGHPAVLMRYLKNHPLANPASYAEPKIVRLSDLSASQEYTNLELEALLFQAGYLTIKDVNAYRIATLGYPNEEVAQSMAQLYADELLGGKVYKAPEGASLQALLAAGSLDEIAARFNSVFNAIDYQRYPVKDEATCRGYLQVLLIGADLAPSVEVHTAHGRSDLEVEAGGRRWVFEVKFARTDEDEARLLAAGIEQMQSRRYGGTLPSEGAQTVVRAVMVFSSRKRQFVRWAAE